MILYVFILCLILLLALRFLYLGRSRTRCKVATTNFDAQNKNNEPFIIQKEKECLIIVTDPVGSLRIGGSACLIAQEIIADHYETNHANSISISPADFLKKACFLAHRAISEQMNANSGGCSIALIYINKKKLSYVSVGDIGIYGCKDELVQLNQLDLYKYQLRNQVLMRKISEERLLNNRLRNELTAYLGHENLKRVNLNEQPIKLFRRDKLLIATKSVYDVITPLTIETIILKRGKPMNRIKDLERIYHEQKQASEKGQRPGSAVIVSRFR